MSKDTRIAFRTSADLKRRLAKVADHVRLNETQLAEACVEALVEYIEEHGEIRLPLAVVPKKRPASFPSTAAMDTPRGGLHLNEEAPARPASVPSPSNPAPKPITRTRAVMRAIAKKAKPPKE